MTTRINELVGNGGGEMAVRKKKRRKHRSTDSRAQAEPYQVACRCGWEMTGLRMARYQVLECGECGGRVFVMPADCYPAASKPDSTVQEAVLVAASAPPSKRKSRSTQRQRKAGSKAAPARELPTELALSEKRRLITPFRVVILVAIVVSLGTGYAVYQRSVVQQAERDFRDHADAGNSAMRDGDFSSAAREYAQAVDALDRLDRDDEHARHVRQMARECRAASELLPISLQELSDHAAEMQSDSDRWERYFQGNAAGKWVVLDTDVYRSSQRDEETSYRIDYPLQIGTVPLILDGNLDVFSRLTFDGKASLRVIVAAQLESCQHSKGQWTLQLNRGSAFLWTDEGNLRALGISDVAASQDDGFQGMPTATVGELKRLLKSQSSMMGVTE